jgi:UDP-N-acetyl-D-mannosaminuronic acid transferase (WecB/TagA/CpsF family)
MKTVFFLIKRKVLSHYVHLGSPRDFAKSIGVLKEGNASASILCVNGYTLLEASKSQEVSLALDKAKVLIPTGKLLRKGVKWLYGHRIDSISLWKLLDVLLKELEVTTFEYHGDEKLKQKLISRYPEIIIKPMLTAGSAAETPIEGKLLLVCLPQASQEAWMTNMTARPDGCIVSLGDLYFKPSFSKRLTHSFLFTGKILNQKLINS